MLIEDVAREFFVYLDAEKGCSPATIEAYGSDLKLFLRFLRGREVQAEVGSVTAKVLREYLADMSARGLSASTRGRRLYSLRSMWHYLEVTEQVTENPCRRVSAPRRVQHVPTHLSVEECARLLVTCDENHYTDLAFRDRAVLTVLIYQGLRRAEVVGLQLRDVDLSAMTLTVRRGKGGSWRVLPLAAAASDAVTDWLEFRPQCDHASLFTTRAGNPMSVRDLHRMFRRTVRRAGLGSAGVTLHSLRHTFALLLLRAGVDVRSLQRLLGHASLETTAQYLHLQTDDLRAAVDRHPLG